MGSGNLIVTPIAYVADDKLPEGRVVIPFVVDFTAAVSIEVDLSNYISVRQLSCIKGLFVNWLGATAQDTVKMTVYGTNQVLIFGPDGTGVELDGYLPIYTNMPAKFIFTKANGAVGGVLTCQATNFEIDPMTWVPLVYQGGAVASFNGRTGAVVPQAGDYTAAQVGAIPAGTGFVSSFNTRTGNVVPAAGDYTAAKVTNALDLSNAGNQTLQGTLFVDGSLSVVGSITAQVGSQIFSNFYSALDGVHGIEVASVTGVANFPHKATFPASASGIVAADVTNAADLSKAGTQTFVNDIVARNLTATGNVTGGTIATTGAVVMQTNMLSSAGNTLSIGDHTGVDDATLEVFSIQTSALQCAGHLVSSGTNPTVTTNPTFTGAGATATIGGTDTRGNVTINTGTAPVAGVIQMAAITFAAPFATAPVVVLTPNKTVGGNVWISVSTTQFFINSVGSVAASTAYGFSYMVMG